MPRTLLLADDSVTIQKMVAMTLRREDLVIVAVDNGEDALAKAREIRPDIVLADVDMPRKNGYELCEAIRADQALSAIPVLLLAGTFEAFDESKALAAQANGRLTKPFESQQLIDRVTELLPRRAAAVEAAPAPARAAPRPPPPPAEALAWQPPAGLPHAPPPRPMSETPPAPWAVSAAPPPVAPAPEGLGANHARGSGTMAWFKAPEPLGEVSTAVAPAVVEGQPPEAPAPKMPKAPEPPAPVVAASPAAAADEDFSIDVEFEDEPPEAALEPATREAPAVAPALAPPTAMAEPLDDTLASPALVALAHGNSRPVPVCEIEVAEEELPAEKAEPERVEAKAQPESKALVVEPEPKPVEPSPATEKAEPPPEPPRAEPAPVVVAPAAAVAVPATAAAPVAVSPAPAATPPPAVDGGEAALRAALSQASVEVIERIAWEVVPQLAEVIIREHVERLARERPPK